MKKFLALLLLCAAAHAQVTPVVPAHSIVGNATALPAAPTALSAQSFAHTFGNSVSILTYGAKGDAVVAVYTVSITSGLHALTATGASFVSTDCQTGTGCTGTNGNKAIAVTGAGVTPTLSGVAITGTAGQFSCTCTGLAVGQAPTISGTFGGTGSITGYSDPTIYYISATDGTSTFTLQTSAQQAIVTTAGTTGLTYAVPTLPLATTISGYTSATAVTLAGAAGTTVTTTSKLVDYGTDDTTAIQNEINAGSGLNFSNHQQFEVFIPCPYKFLITSALVLPPATKVAGCGREPGSQIIVAGSGAIVIDGSSYGGWDKFIEVEGLFFDMTNAVAANCVYLHSSYYVRIRDVWFNNSGPGCGSAEMAILTGNDIVLDNVSIAGNSSAANSNPLGLRIDGASVRMFSVDREYFAVGWESTGAPVVDDTDPYIESSHVPYIHDITSGQVNIFGGTYSGNTGAPYLIDIQKDNLAIYGTYLPSVSYVTSVFNVPATASFTNVRTFGLFNGYGNSWFASGANLAAVEMLSPAIGHVDRKTIDITKQLTSATPTGLASFKTSGVMNCVVTVFADIHTGAGNGTVSTKYTFTIGAGLVPNIVVDDVSTASNSNWIIGLSAPTLTVSSAVYSFGLTATVSGALGTGLAADVWAKIEYSSYDPSATNAVRAL
jgi:hypothetical protein